MSAASSSAETSGQHAAHRRGQCLVQPGGQGVGAAVAPGLHERADQAAYQFVRRVFALFLGPFTAGQSSEVGQFLVGGDARATRFARCRGQRLGAGPGQYLLGGAVGARLAPEVAAKGAQLLEQVHRLDDLVGVKIVDRGDRHRDYPLVAVERQLQFDLHARDHVVQIVDVDLDRLALGQSRAGFQQAGIGAAGEVADDRQAEFRPRCRGPRTALDCSETDGIVHFRCPLRWWPISICHR
jgi:hypothetical protein